MRRRGRERTTFGHRMKLMEVFDPYYSFVAYHNDSPLADTRARKKIGLRCFCPLDVCAEFAQFFIEMLVSAVDVVDAAYFGNSVCL